MHRKNLSGVPTKCFRQRQQRHVPSESYGLLLAKHASKCKFVAGKIEDAGFGSLADLLAEYCGVEKPVVSLLPLQEAEALQAFREFSKVLIPEEESPEHPPLSRFRTDFLPRPHAVIDLEIDSGDDNLGAFLDGVKIPKESLRAEEESFAAETLPSVDPERSSGH